MDEMDESNERVATPAQQEAYDACLSVARAMQHGEQPTPAQMQRIERAMRVLRSEPQPPGLVESLEDTLRTFFPDRFA